MSTPTSAPLDGGDPERSLVRLLEALPEEPAGADQSSTRERILDAAIETFAARGFRSTTVRDLAAAVGIKAPGLYAHFTSKEEILSRAMLRALKGFLRYMTAGSRSETPEEVLEQTVRRHVRYQLEHLRATRANDLLLASDALRDFLLQRDYERVREAQQAYYTVVQSRIGAALPSGSAVDPAVTAHALISMCNLVTSLHRGGESVPPIEDVADHYWFLTRGMLRLPDVAALDAQP